MKTTADFRRARTPQQIAQRRADILHATSALVGELPVTKITLQAITERAGLATSGLLRYFESREAILLAVMNDEADRWLDALADEVATRDFTGEPSRRAERFAQCVADTIVAAPTLCDLFSASAALVIAELSVEVATDYKSRNLVALQRLARLTRDCVPEMTEPAALGYAGTTLALVAGMWPYARPTPAIEKAIEAVGYPSVSKDFNIRLARVLSAQAIGILACTQP